MLSASIPVLEIKEINIMNTNLTSQRGPNVLEKKWQKKVKKMNKQKLKHVKSVVTFDQPSPTVPKKPRKENEADSKLFT